MLYVSQVVAETNPDGHGVDTILFGTDAINVMRAGEGNTLSFISTDSTATRVRHTDIRQPDLTQTGAIAGQFVGKVIDGPLGIIGTWSVTGVEGGDALEGVYGADLMP